MKVTITQWIYRLIALILLFLCIYLLHKLSSLWLPPIRSVFKVFIPFIIAAFITYLLHPLIERLHGNGVPRTVAILSIYLLFFGGIGFVVYKFLPAMIQQLKDLAQNLPHFFNQYRTWANEIDRQTSRWPEGLHERVEAGFTYMETWLSTSVGKMVSGVRATISSLLVIALIPFLVFYMLKDIQLIKKTIWYMAPRKWRRPGIRFLRDVNESLGGYIRGQLLVCFLIGSVAGLFLWVMGIEYPLLLGIFIGITNIIPYFGPLFGAIPALIIAATLSVKMVVYVGVLILALQFLEGNILSPMIVGRSLHMHPMIIMLALLLGGELGGVLGLLIAVPMFAILKVTITHARLHFLKRTRGEDSLTK